MSRGNILYIEDEISLASIVSDTLRGVGFEVQWFDSGKGILRKIEQYHIDLVILDIMLPNQNGFELAKEISNTYPEVPFLFTSAKNQAQDVIQGLKLGAKDYLKKPFHLEELLLRIGNIISSNNPDGITNKQSVTIGRYEFNSFDQTLILEEEVKNLTYLETEIINYIAQRKNKDILKKNMLVHIWGDDTNSNSRNLDVYINKVRDYLSQDPSIRIITLRAKGYRFIIDKK